MQKGLIAILITLLINASFAQTIIEGSVMDAETARPLPGAHILLTPGKQGFTSDQNGSFLAKGMKAGTYKLRLSFIGYESQTKNITIKKDQKLKLDFKLNPGIYTSDEVIVTATRNQRRIDETPGSIKVISRQEIRQMPSDKVDDIIQYASGVNVLRSSGIYTMRPVVTLRGLSGDEQGRTLILLDGVPINKGDTGGVNWNRIDKNNIQRIEIFRGPGSSLYGNNAMGGVINIITRKPAKNMQGNAGMSFGTFNTQQANAGFGSRINDKFWYAANAFYTNSDGYNAIPDSLRTNPDYSVPRFLNEKGISGKMGYNSSKLLKLELQVDYFEDKRGEGEKIRAPQGEYRSFNTHFVRGKAKGDLGVFQYDLNGYFQKEHYFRIDERERNGDYSRFDVESDRIDLGLILHMRSNIGQYQVLSYGMETRQSSVDGGDYYRTSPDTIENSGKMKFSAIYIQDEISLLSGKLKIIAGLRFDHAKFFDGNYYSTDGSWTGVLPELRSNSWESVSPRISASFKTGTGSKVYLSYARGFRASILDDLCRSGWMWIGPKIANPELGPETIDNFELGADLQASENVRFAASVYYSKGNDFLYYVRTGDSLWGRRPVYQRQNVTAVDIYGAEIESEIRLGKQIGLFAYYTFNSSEIAAFDKDPALEGKQLKYNPQHQIKANLLWNNPVLTSSFSLIYKSKQFTDDLNTSEIEAYVSADVKLSKNLDESLEAYLQLQNLFDEQHMDNDLYLSPGRMIQVGFNVNF